MARTLNHDRLMVEIDRRGWSLQHLADKAGIARSTLSRATAGEEITASTLARIAMALRDHPPIEGITELVAR